jgi:hypothetical protein
VAVVGTVYLLSAEPAAYGASKVEAREQDWGSRLAGHFEGTGHDQTDDQA